MNFSNQTGELKVQFWGVRGSIPTPLDTHLQVGGNTACVVLQWGDEAHLIIDAGTGIRSFGQQLRTRSTLPFEGTLLLSHFHWDHIQGFPFFSPIYSKHTKLKIVSARPPSELKENLNRQMQEPYFPMGFREIPAQYSCDQLEDDGLSLGSLSVTPIGLNHPGGATGFRVDSPNGSVVYVSDHEHGNLTIDRQIITRVAEADLMIYDAHFTPEEYPHFVGWGHSTWLEGARIAKEAGVRALALFHHNPVHTDGEMEELVQSAQEYFGATSAANEHMPMIVTSNT